MGELFRLAAIPLMPDGIRLTSGRLKPLGVFLCKVSALVAPVRPFLSFAAF
jgi:hypothetical protein